MTSLIISGMSHMKRSMFQVAPKATIRRDTKAFSTPKSNVKRDLTIAGRKSYELDKIVYTHFWLSVVVSFRRNLVSALELTFPLSFTFFFFCHREAIILRYKFLLQLFILAALISIRLNDTYIFGLMISNIKQRKNQFFKIIVSQACNCFLKPSFGSTQRRMLNTNFKASWYFIFLDHIT